MSTEDELAWLEDIGAAGAVLGMAMYMETIDVEQVAHRWGGRTEERGAR